MVSRIRLFSNSLSRIGHKISVKFKEFANKPIETYYIRVEPPLPVLLSDDAGVEALSQAVSSLGRLSQRQCPLLDLCEAVPFRLQHGRPVAPQAHVDQLDLCEKEFNGTEAINYKSFALLFCD